MRILDTYLRYPPECPVFINTHEGKYLRAGALVELVELEEQYVLSTGLKVPCPGYVGVRVLDTSFVTNAGLQRTRCAEWYGFVLYPRDLDPLTPRARAFLDAVQDRQYCKDKE